ncbi:hypothetical protein MRB53_038873 [Persea americana]|nr:hypothetical protein MRB53_038873 [Persea americana]
MNSDQDRYYMQLALNEAKKSPPKATNFCVGAVLVSKKFEITGFTLEMPGNTHAEQSAFLKLAAEVGVEEEQLGDHLLDDTVLYTTMEPCNKRSVGNMPCVDRILRLKNKNGQAICRVCVGVSEPETFVGVNEGRKKLVDAGIVFDIIPGFEDDILATATAGHSKNEE